MAAFGFIVRRHLFGYTTRHALDFTSLKAMISPGATGKSKVTNIAESGDSRCLQGKTHSRYGEDMESAQTGSTPKSAADVALQPALLGAGVLFSVFLNIMRFFPADTTAGEFALHPFAVATGWGCVACGIVLASSTLWLRHAGRRALDPLQTPLLVLGTLCTAVGMLGALPLYTGLSLPFVEPTLFGALFGIGLVALTTSWGALFARLEPENLLYNSAFGIVMAAVLHFSAAPLSPSPTGVIFIACSLIASCVLLFIARRNTEASSPTSMTASLPEQPLDEPAQRRAVLSKALGILWMPLVGACITSFIFGLTWDPIISSEQTRLLNPLGDWKSFIGPLLIAAIVALMAMHKADSSPLRLLNQAVYPVAVALLLALPVIVADTATIAAVVDVLTQASFAVIALAIWCSMASAARSVPVSPALVFPVCFVLLALAFVAGLCGIAIIGTDGRTLCLVILAVYLALIAVSFALGNKSQKESRTEPRPTADSRTYIHRRCDELSASHGLSPREREVLYYLGRGYNHGYVAEKLYISENTVRTHVRHIYTKLEISSREELLSMIDTADDEG